MKSLFKSLTVLCCVLGVSGCNFVKAVARGDGAGAVNAAGHLVQIGIDADNKAKSNCDGLGKRTVPWEEERAIGGAIAVGLGTQSKGFLIDGNLSKDAKALKEKVDAKQEVALDDTERNRLNGYLAVVGRALAANSERPDIAWTFGVIDNPAENAFSAPGGYVFVTSGLLKRVENEAQLAGILAHEIGHVSLRHALKTYSTIKQNQCEVATRASVWAERGVLDQAPSIVRNGARLIKDIGKLTGAKVELDRDVSVEMISALTDGVVDSVTTNGLAKPDEFAADKAAQELMISVGYDPAEYEKFLALFKSGGGWLEHHPSSDERISALVALRKDNAFPATAKPANPPEFSVIK